VKFDWEKAEEPIISRRKYIALATVVIVVFCLYKMTLMFPAVEYKGKKMRIFSYEQIVEIEKSVYVEGNILGSQVLETEYGSISLKSFCLISVYRGSFQIWTLTDTVYYFPVQLPGQTEFSKYSSITFKKAWGEFIEGELIVEATQ
jgi:hypothetical protein